MKKGQTERQKKRKIERQAEERSKRKIKKTKTENRGREN